MTSKLTWLSVCALILASCLPSTPTPPPTATLPFTTPTPTLIGQAAPSVPPTPARPGSTATAVPTPQPSETATPTAIPEAPTGGTQMPHRQPEGFSITFTHLASSGFATMTASARSCDTLEGPWKGEVQLSFAYQDMAFAAAGPLEFSGLPGSRKAEGTATLSGSGAAKRCTLTSVSDPLRVEVSFATDGTSAEIMIGSQGAGMLTVVCPGNPPVSASLPFAMFWAPEPIVVPITPHAGCP